MKEFVFEYNTSEFAVVCCFGRRCGEPERRHLMCRLALQIIRQLELEFPDWRFVTAPYTTDRDRYYRTGTSSDDGQELERIEEAITEIAPLVYKRLSEYPEIIDRLTDDELALLHQLSRFYVHDQTITDILFTLLSRAQHVCALNSVAISASVWPRGWGGRVIVSHYPGPDLTTSAHMSFGSVRLDCSMLLHEIAHVLTMSLHGAHPGHDEVFVGCLRDLLAALDADALHRLANPLAREVKEEDMGMQDSVECFLWCGDEEGIGLDLAVQPCEDINDGMTWGYQRIKDTLPRRMQYAMEWFEGEFLRVSGLPQFWVPDPITQGLLDGTLVIGSEEDFQAARAAASAASVTDS